MRIIGLTRIRNEEVIIKDTLDHMANFCDEVVIYDDCSTDNTVNICIKHPIVTNIVIGIPPWTRNRKRAEWENRAKLLKEAKKIATENDWFVYIDADERIEYDWDLLKSYNINIIGVKMKLFDFYITPRDVKKHYTERKWIGPEYRNILIAFRNLKTLDYSSPDQREVHLRSPGKIINSGFVKHYGKAISIEQWEETCYYYSTYFRKYAKKWEARKGKAIHTYSSFGNKLIKWEQKDKLGFQLTKEIEKYNIYENPSNKSLA